MTIELITGVPGAGKTTYAVAARIVPESTKRFVVPPGDAEQFRWFVQLRPERSKVQSDGSISISRRLVCAGVRGLVIDHERLPHKLTGDNVSVQDVDTANRMARSPDGKEEDYPELQRLADTPPRIDAPYLVQSWWTWCEPGDFIVVDEVQFLAPRGIMGRKPPYWIQALEIHRHYGVDFLFITQAPGLIDMTIRNLVGMHRHVRSVMGSPLCTVYAWDHASNTERISNSSKSAFLRRPVHYKLFKSASAHMAAPSAGRKALMLVPMLAIAVALGTLVFRDKYFGKAQAAQTPAAQQASGKQPASVGPRAPNGPLFAGGVGSPVVSGCWSQGERCECMTAEGYRVHVEAQTCRASAAGVGLVAWKPSTAVRYEARQPAQTGAAAVASPSPQSRPQAAVPGVAAVFP